MTCCVAIRVPGRGAVLAADSRVTQGTEILTDRCDKLLRCGSVALGIAGQDGGLMMALSVATDLAEVITQADKYTKDRHLDWSALLYDSMSGQLGYLDSDGSVLASEHWAVGVGSGSTWALGWLMAQKRPKSLDTAVVLARNAVKVACKRDACCGGRIRTLRL